MNIERLPLETIRPGDNDRTVFDPAALQELADSIKEQGLLQPISVRRVDGHYVIIAGERRFRACQLAGMTHIDAIVQDMNDEAASLAMLKENVSRKDLDPLDEAQAYQRRITDFGYTPEVLARLAGVSEKRVKGRLALLTLRPDIQELVRNGHLALGYADILANARLDANRQLLAIRALRENPAPTPAWYRRVCGELVEQQAQDAMFDLSLLNGALEAKPDAKATLPPTPTTYKPKARPGQSVQEAAQEQLDIWTRAAQEWGQLGHADKRNECLAAATAFSMLLDMLDNTPRKAKVTVEAERKSPDTVWIRLRGYGQEPYEARLHALGAKYYGGNVSAFVLNTDLDIEQVIAQVEGK